MSTADDRPDDDRDLDRPSERRRDRERDGAHYEEPHRGTLILVLGIVSLVACPILGPIAWIMGNGDLKKMDEGVMDPEGKSNTNVGKILGIVGTVLLALQVLAFVFYIVVIGFVVANAQPPKAAPQNQPVFKMK
jgi:hypothetical protein